MTDARRYLFDLPGIYRIRVRGRLGARESASFACTMTCTSRLRGDLPDTTLTGELVDQAGLISLLTQLYDMGYPLLAVKRLSDVAPPSRTVDPLRAASRGMAEGTAGER